MSSDSAFGSAYAAAYDALYIGKDYDAECRFLTEAFSRHADGKVQRIVDLGCGTGGHALRLADLGHEVTGIDRSDAMVALAQAKLANAPDAKVRDRVRFQVGDIVEARGSGEYDAAIMMFAVMGYITGTDRLGQLLRNVRSQLRRGGLFVADFWYGPAVLTDRPGDRVRVIEQGEKLTVRATRTTLDTFTQVAKVQFELFNWSAGVQLERTIEVHDMRYFFAQELSLLCGAAGLEIVRVCPFLAIDSKLDETTWNAAIVARAI